MTQNLRPWIGLIGGLACLVGQRASANATAMADSKIQFTLTPSSGTLANAGSDFLMTSESAGWQSPLITDADVDVQIGALFPTGTATASSSANGQSFADGKVGFALVGPDQTIFSESHAKGILPPGVNGTASSRSQGSSEFTRSGSLADWSLTLTPFGLQNQLSISLDTTPASGGGISARGSAEYHIKVTVYNSFDQISSETRKSNTTAVPANFTRTLVTQFADPFVVNGISGAFSNVRIEWDTFASIEVNQSAHQIPDGGATVLMLGTSLLALQAVRRRAA